MPRPRPRQRRRPGPASRTASSFKPSQPLQPSQPQQGPPPPPAKSSTDFEICIHDIPRFRPGTTPPQPPLSLLPVHDTDAFIIGKLVSPFGLPDEKDDLDDDDDNDNDNDNAELDGDSEFESDERRRRALQQLLAATAASHDQHGKDERHRHTVRRVLNYVVGWPDVPYARRLVPCTEVLDYVSPRTLEAWEYAATLREHEAAAAAAAARKRGGHKAQLQNGGGERETAIAQSSAQPPKNPQPQRKRRRRKLLGPAKKRKAPPPPPPPPPAAATEASSTPAPAKAELILPTLSTTPTPRPNKLHTPLARPASSSNAAAAAAAATTTPASNRQQQLVLNIPSLASGKQRTGLSLTQPYRPATATSAGAASSRPHDAFSSAAVAAVAAARARVSTTPRSSGYKRVPAHNVDMMDVDELAADDWENDLRRPAGLAAPPADGAAEDKDIYYGEEETQTAPAAASIANSTDEDDNETDEQLLQQQEALLSAQRITYIPPPTLPYHFSPAKQRAGNVASLSTVPRPQSQPAEGTSTSNTVLKRKREASETVAAQVPAVDEEEQVYDEGAAAEEEEDDELYEVEAIEDDYMMESGEGSHHGSSKRAGKGQSAPVRFFLVRWKGDWPPDQNPTWEPAENLPPDMVRQYLKKATRHKAKSSGNRNANGS